MFTAIAVILILVALLVGLIMSLRSSAKTGMPPEDVLERTTRRARELEAQEKARQQKRGG
jgi:hypothetical protein